MDRKVDARNSRTQDRFSRAVLIVMLFGFVGWVAALGEDLSGPARPTASALDSNLAMNADGSRYPDSPSSSIQHRSGPIA
jgi:hypothetical protein